MSEADASSDARAKLESSEVCREECTGDEMVHRKASHMLNLAKTEPCKQRASLGHAVIPHLRKHVPL